MINFKWFLDEVELKKKLEDLEKKDVESENKVEEKVCDVIFFHSNMLFVLFKRHKYC